MARKTREPVNQMTKETDGRKSKITTESFIEKAKEVHGDRYDYSKVVYVSSNSLVEIICPKHGLFLQRPSRHTSGNGCNACGSERQAAKTSAAAALKFEDKARSIHGDKYTYEKVVYGTRYTKIIVTCPSHGDFETTPDRFYTGRGCRKCYDERQTTTQSDWIKRATEYHKGRYDYSSVVYVNARSLVKIICPVHGEFEQNAHAHLDSGCRHCSSIERGLKSSIEESLFLARAKEKHGDKFKYSNYTNYTTKVTITCEKHGDFKQMPYAHIKGHGCPICRNQAGKFSYKEKCSDPEFAKRDGCVYLLRLRKDDEVFGKVGVSVNLKQRIAAYKIEGLDVTILAKYDMTALQSLDIEEMMLEYFVILGIKYNPSFSFSGMTECFDLNYFGEIDNFLLEHLHPSCGEETDCVFELDPDDDFCYNTYSIEQEMEDERLAPINPWGKNPC